MKILVAEDSRVARKVLCDALSQMGHTLVASEDGRQALEVYQREAVDTIITDWMMPEMDGLELCRRIRAIQRERYTYIILLTAMGGKDNYLEGLAAGADDFITKPFDSEELAARLQVAARIVGLRQHVQRLEALLPICMYCKKIRDKDNKWVAIESYISIHTETQFSHGYCPECLKAELQQLGRE